MNRKTLVAAATLVALVAAPLQASQQTVTPEPGGPIFVVRQPEPELWPAFTPCGNACPAGIGFQGL